MKSYSTALLLFACYIRPTKAINTAIGRGLYRINGATANTNVNAATASKYRRRDTSRDLFDEDNQAMFRMLNAGWEMEAYGSLSMSFSMSFSMSLSMPSSSSSPLSPTTTRSLLEAEPADVQIIVRRRRLSVIDEEEQQLLPKQQESNNSNLDGQAMIHLSFAFVAVLIASVLVIDLVKRKRSAKSGTLFHDHQLIIASSHSS